MTRLIPAWTEQQTLVAGAGLVALIGAGAAVAEGGAGALVIIAALALTFVLALSGDAWTGLVIGLASAAVCTFIRQANGTWLPADFGPAAIESVALVATGWSAGRVGTQLRAQRAPEAPPDEFGAFGSVGMLPPDLGLVRLEEEVARGLTYHRPLSLLLLDTVITDAGLDDDAQEEAFRAVARVTETMLREMDVPFQVAAHRIAAILPETDPNAAAIATGRILEALLPARFVDRRANQRRALQGAVSVRLAVTSLGDTYGTADALFDAATSALRG
jgi:hypothetical protein